MKEINLLLETKLGCYFPSFIHRFRNLPITGSDKTHLMGAPTSKMDFIASFRWPPLEKLDKYAYILSLISLIQIIRVQI
jgi:hypothetical protein